jgi:hypothetical protein
LVVAVQLLLPMLPDQMVQIVLLQAPSLQLVAELAVGTTQPGRHLVVQEAVQVVVIPAPKESALMELQVKEVRAEMLTKREQTVDTVEVVVVPAQSAETLSLLPH